MAQQYIIHQDTGNRLHIGDVIIFDGGQRIGKITSIMDDGQTVRLVQPSGNIRQRNLHHNQVTGCGCELNQLSCSAWK